jgi:type II secretory pathway predicted ATPase ExeA
MPLDPVATADYIRHRMQHAGSDGEVFSDDAIEAILRQTGGVPRLVNKLCEFCLVYGALNEERVISEGTVDQVISDGVFVSGFTPIERAAE